MWIEIREAGTAAQPTVERLTLSHATPHPADWDRSIGALLVLLSLCGACATPRHTPRQIDPHGATWCGVPQLPGTAEMMQPCSVHLHTISSVAPHQPRIVGIADEERVAQLDFLSRMGSARCYRKGLLHPAKNRTPTVIPNPPPAPPRSPSGRYGSSTRTAPSRCRRCRRCCCCCATKERACEGRSDRADRLFGAAASRCCCCATKERACEGRSDRVDRLFGAAASRCRCRCCATKEMRYRQVRQG